ncbi:MAG: histidine triad nucleotide-binding protein [Leptospiraceae bacterium]|nr:histidine triad nucleotide-binding protein [Leptospiraceae bacterium]MCP5510479.1 histidine triad nucleotide-binding protein [Leptospiraceae bacterium]
MSESCIFCKILNKEIPSEIVFEDEVSIGFSDRFPVSPTHVLFIPKKHIESLDKLTEEDSGVVGRIFMNISKFAREKGLNGDGYRVVNNMGSNGGQTVFHIHFHLLAGRAHAWPPG